LLAIFGSNDQLTILRPSFAHGSNSKHILNREVRIQIGAAAKWFGSAGRGVLRVRFCKLNIALVEHHWVVHDTSVV
jgi:hypothetical protein